MLPPPSSTLFPYTTLFRSRRQLEAYRQSAATLNLLRAFATGGYANLANAHQWMLSFVKDSPQSKRYQELANHITEALGFIDRKSTRLNSSHLGSSYAVFCL